MWMKKWISFPFSLAVFALNNKSLGTSLASHRHFFQLTSMGIRLFARYVKVLSVLEVLLIFLSS